MGKQLSVNVHSTDDLFLWTNEPFSPSNGLFGRVNDPNRTASEPFSPSNVPFGRMSQNE